MIGAIVGDIVGSRFEFNNLKSKNFNLFTEKCTFTDDSVMSIAVCQAIMDCNGDYTLLDKTAEKRLREFGLKYPDRGYGGMFYTWLNSPSLGPYNSFGNGAAMRVSACGWSGKDITEVKLLAQKVTEPTHNHPQGIKGAEATAIGVYWLRTGQSPKDLRNLIESDYYSLNFTLEDIRDSYKFNPSCQQTVPQAFQAFFEANSFEDAIRNAISIGGDSDTIAAITGSLAEAYYGVPENIYSKAFSYLDKNLQNILLTFEKEFSK